MLSIDHNKTHQKKKKNSLSLHIGMVWIVKQTNHFEMIGQTSRRRERVEIVGLLVTKRQRPTHKHTC